MFSMQNSLGLSGERSRYSGGETTSRRKNISQEGINKIMEDILGSEQGLASLANGENISGGTNSTTKTQLSQDLVTKLSGELAVLTAEDVTTTNKSGKSSKVGAESTTKGGYEGTGASVICTELNRQGKLDTELYIRGQEHFQSLRARTIRGYQVWAKKLVHLMVKSERLSKFMYVIAQARYLHITGDKKNFLGLSTVIFGQPICYVIGFLMEKFYGYRVYKYS